jgi:signal transduction histidine kinase
MFDGIRHRLTLWYTGVLAAILLLAGLLLFVGMQTVLMRPVNASLALESLALEQRWQSVGAVPPACSTNPFARAQSAFLIACFDARGNVLGANGLANFSSAFLSPTLAQAALANPSSPVQDTVDEANGLGAIRREAVVVRDPSTHQVLGVLQAGISINGEVRALRTLVMLLLLVGALTLFGSAIGGVLLSGRALGPARLAFARQRTFIADASHELRTPLTLLRADAEVLLRGRDQLDPDDAALLDDIVAESEHMGALAENLLTLARLDNGVYHMERDVVDLAAVASDIAHRAHALAEAKQVALIVENAGPVLIVADGTWLGEAALILLDNAIKYNRPGGKVSLRTSLDGEQAVLEIRDTGIGIASEHLPHLGERFYRVDKARSREMGGAGLGLSIARSIAAAHDGTLTLTSVPGEGTIATLRLPAARAGPP